MILVLSGVANFFVIFEWFCIVQQSYLGIHQNICILVRYQSSYKLRSCTYEMLIRLNLVNVIILPVVVQ